MDEDLKELIQQGLSSIKESIDTMKTDLTDKIDSIDSRLTGVERSVADVTQATNAGRSEGGDEVDDLYNDKPTDRASRVRPASSVVGARDAWDSKDFKLQLQPIKYQPVSIAVTAQNKLVVEGGVKSLVRGIANRGAPFGQVEMLRVVVEVCSVNDRADVDSLAEEEGRDAEEVLDEAIVSALYHDPEKHSMAHSMAATLRKVATSFNSDVKPVIFEKCYQHKAVEAGINISPTTPELEQQLYEFVNKQYESLLEPDECEWVLGRAYQAVEKYAELPHCNFFFDDEGDFPSRYLKAVAKSIAAKWPGTKTTLYLYALAAALIKAYKYSYDRRVGGRQASLAMTFPDQQELYSTVLAVHNCMCNATLCPTTEEKCQVLFKLQKKKGAWVEPAVPVVNGSKPEKKKKKARSTAKPTA